MSTKTDNFGLIKPELTDRADITAFNNNWDEIDKQLKNVKEQVEVQPNQTNYYEATLV